MSGELSNRFEDEPFWSIHIVDCNGGQAEVMKASIQQFQMVMSAAVKGIRPRDGSFQRDFSIMRVGIPIPTAMRQGVEYGNPTSRAVVTWAY